MKNEAVDLAGCFHWPVQSRPVISLANRFRLDDCDFRVIYNQSPSGNFAIHQYEYAATIKAAGQTIDLKPGDVTLTPPDVQTSYDLPKPGYHICVHFSCPGKSRECIALPFHHRLGSDVEYVRVQLASIIRLHVEGVKNSLQQIRAELALQDLLLWLSDRQQQKESSSGIVRSQTAVRKAAELLEARLDQPLNVTDLAREVGLSQSYFARCFRLTFGCTVHAHLLSRRMQLAAYLLTSTTLSVGEIAGRVGYADAQHFNKKFRAVFGIAPTQYRLPG